MLEAIQFFMWLAIIVGALVGYWLIFMIAGLGIWESALMALVVVMAIQHIGSQAVEAPDAKTSRG